MARTTTIAAASAALLLSVPGLAVAKAPAKEKPVKTAQFNFKGTYAGENAVAVTKGNGAAKKAGFVGQTVTFDFTSAKVVVDDVNADGKRDLADVQVGDKVVVKVKAPRGSKPGDALTARQLVDQTHAVPSTDDVAPSTDD